MIRTLNRQHLLPEREFYQFGPKLSNREKEKRKTEREREEETVKWRRREPKLSIIENGVTRAEGHVGLSASDL